MANNDDVGDSSSISKGNLIMIVCQEKQIKNVMWLSDNKCTEHWKQN